MADDAHSLTPEQLEHFDRTGRIANPPKPGTTEGLAAAGGVLVGLLGGSLLGFGIVPPIEGAVGPDATDAQRLEDARRDRVRRGIVGATILATTAGSVALASKPERRATSVPVAVASTVAVFGGLWFLLNRVDDFSTRFAIAVLGVPLVVPAIGISTALVTESIEGGKKSKRKR